MTMSIQTRIAFTRRVYSWASILSAVVLAATTVACRSEQDSDGKEQDRPTLSANSPREIRQPIADDGRPGPLIGSSPESANELGGAKDASKQTGDVELDHQQEARQFAELLLGEDADSVLNAPSTGVKGARHPVIDATIVRAAGIRTLVGQHLTLYTDVPSQPAVDELPEVFDRAVPLWCEYFDVPFKRCVNWRQSGYLIQDEQRFRNAGLFPDDLPEFLHGYQRGYELWFYDQPSDYFRRHLLLHEGTHGFMHRLLGGVGAAWYAEGVAELLGTHRWADGRLTLGYFPRQKKEVPMWGRIKIIRDQFARQRALMIGQVMRSGISAPYQVESYAWCWAAAAFLDGHPQFRNRFRSLRSQVSKHKDVFTARFEQQFEPELRQLDEQWQLFIAGMEYGYDLQRNAVQYKTGVPIPPEGATVSVAVDRGWQSSGYRMQAGKSYRITATGRYKVAETTEPWWCEPGGVTIRYYRGRPLGMLLGKVRLDEPRPGLALLTQPSAIGLQRTVTPTESGTLYFRINDSPAELADNAGTLKVTITPDK